MRHLTALNKIRALATSPADSARAQIYKIASEAVFVGDEGRPQDRNDEAVLNLLDRQEGTTADTLRSFIEAAFADRLAVERYERGGKPAPQTAPALANLAKLSTDYDDARQALADAEDDAADDVAKDGMDTAAGAAFDLARGFLDAVAQMRAAYGVLHDDLSDLVEGALIADPARRKALADMLAGPCMSADKLAETVLAGQPVQPAPDVNGVMLAALHTAGDVLGEYAAVAPSGCAADALADVRAAITAAEAQGGQVADVPAILPDVPVIAVDALQWQEIGEEHQPKARLLAALQIGDCMFHVEAREIDPESDLQSTLEYGDDFDKFGDIADQGDFATMTREGRQYFVFILPYEA